MPAMSLLPRARRRLLALGALWLALGAAQAQTSALHPPGPSADSVKAAFILKFLNYVEWPATAFASDDAPCVLAVQGDEDVLAELQRQSAGRNFNRHPLMVRALDADEVPPGVQLLYIGERARIAPLAHALHAPVLVVTDADGALELGSMINFRLVDDRVRFEVALDPVRGAGLQLNSRLLSVALAVNKGSSP